MNVSKQSFCISSRKAGGVLFWLLQKAVCPEGGIEQGENVMILMEKAEGVAEEEEPYLQQTRDKGDIPDNLQKDQKNFQIPECSANEGRNYCSVYGDG